jgi:hypothetical protein
MGGVYLSIPLWKTPQTPHESPPAGAGSNPTGGFRNPPCSVGKYPVVNTWDDDVPKKVIPVAPKTLHEIAEEALGHAMKAYEFSPTAYGYECANSIRRLIGAIRRMEAEAVTKEREPECVS